MMREAFFSFLAAGLLFSCSNPPRYPIYNTYQHGGIILNLPPLGHPTYPCVLGTVDTPAFSLAMNNQIRQLLPTPAGWQLSTPVVGSFMGMPAGDGPGGKIRGLLLITPEGHLKPQLPEAQCLRMASGKLLQIHPGCRPALADYNGDGPLDLIALPVKGGPLSLWSGTQNGRFTPPQPLAHPQVPETKVLCSLRPGEIMDPGALHRNVFAQVTLRRNNPGPWSAGLVLRSAKVGDLRLTANFNGKGQMLQLLALLGTRVIGKTSVVLGPTDGKWHRLALLIKGNTAVIYWDGQQRQKITDFHQGNAKWQVGLSTNMGKTFFKGFRLTPPPGSGPGEIYPQDPLLTRGKQLTGEWQWLPPFPHPARYLYHLTGEEARPGLCLESIDWNGDGMTDLLLAGPTFPVRVYLSRGKGQFANPTTLNVPPPGNGISPVTAADLDQDNRPDLLLTYADGTLRLFPGNWFPNKTNPW